MVHEDNLEQKKRRKEKELLIFLKRRPITRNLTNMLMKCGIYTVAPVMIMREIIKGTNYEEIKRMTLILANRKYRVGLLEGSIFQNELLYPDNEGNLTSDKAIPGRFVSYDLRSKEILGKDPNRKGRLFTANLEEIAENDSETLTSINLFDSLRIEHFLSMDSSTINQAIEYGFIRKTNYMDAYTRLGLDKKYGKNLILRKMDESEVYQVTPKGNTLVIMAKDGGDKNEKKKENKAPAWNPIFQPA